MATIRTPADLLATIDRFKEMKAEIDALMERRAHEDLRAVVRKSKEAVNLLLDVQEFVEATKNLTALLNQGVPMERVVEAWEFATEKRLKELWRIEDEALISLRLPLEGFTSWENLAERLYNMRKHSGVTQQEVAEALRPAVSKSAVAHIESGRNKPSIETVVQWADACGYTVEFKFRPKGPRPMADRVAGLTSSLDDKDQVLVAVFALMLRQGKDFDKALLAQVVQAFKRHMIHDAIDPDTMELEGNDRKRQLE